jgi:hypothetical protein
MGLVVPKLRKHLSADALFDSVRTVFAHIADHRQGDSDISLTDALMSAFAIRTSGVLHPEPSGLGGEG